MPSINDILHDEVGASLADEENAAPFIRSGAYNVRLGAFHTQPFPDWHPAFEKYDITDRFRVGLTFLNEDEEKIGYDFIDLCPFEFQQYGREGNESKLWKQLKQALAAKEGETIFDFITRAEGAIVNVFGRETYRVPISMLPEEKRDAAIERGASPDEKRRQYLEDDDETLRLKYQPVSRASFTVFNIRAAKVAYAGE